MRSSSTAKRSPAEAQAVRDLVAIRKFIAPLAPPVYAFEASIRSTPFRILVSVLLSARTHDAVTEKAAARLFAAAATPQKMARLSKAEVERRIYPVGFYRTKADHILKLCAALNRGGKFPATMEGLLELPGVGRKSANLVLALAFKRPAIAVDTHVFRISRRLGWADGAHTRRGGEGAAGSFPPPALGAGQPGPGRVRADRLPADRAEVPRVRAEEDLPVFLSDKEQVTSDKED